MFSKIRHVTKKLQVDFKDETFVRKGGVGGHLFDGRRVSFSGENNPKGYAEHALEEDTEESKRHRITKTLIQARVSNS